MSNRISHQTNDTDSQDKLIDVHANEEGNDCGIVLFFLFNYLLYIFLNFMSINYLFLFILFKDAQENEKYAITEVKGWKATPIILASGGFYLVSCLQGLYFSCKYTRHFFPITISTFFWGIWYIKIVLSTVINNNCQKRTLLTCYEKTDHYDLTSRNLNTSQTYLTYALLSLIAFQVILTVITCCLNKRVKYYFSKNTICEFIELLIFYFTASLFLALLPILCCFGGPTLSGSDSNLQITLGNIANGQEYISPINAIV